MKCIKCGEEVSGGKFCPKCGQSLTCPKCGAPRINDFKFCNECGYGFNEAALSDADNSVNSSAAADSAVAAQCPERDKEAVFLGGGTALPRLTA